MARAVICPVCLGTGKVPVNYISTALIEETCHGCHGRGWVEVSN